MDGLDTDHRRICVGTIRAGTPLVFAALGELIAEKSGVLNLGVEGMMLVGAVAGLHRHGADRQPLCRHPRRHSGRHPDVADLRLVLTLLLTNQVATGLALTIFGIGLSAFIGLDYVGTPIDGLRTRSPFRA